MKKHSVPVAYGLRIFDPGVLEVQSREFPNAIDDVGGGCVVGEASESKVFECPECRRKKNIWIKKNKDTRHVTATAISGKPGFVYSPFTGKVVDVTGLAEGAIVRDPTTSKITTEMKIFRVPAPSR